MEQAAEQSGEDVDVDVDVDATGDGVSVPAGWPGLPLPEGRLFSATTVGETIGLSYEVESDDAARAVVDELIASGFENIAETDYADACPIATIALEVASTSEPLRRATADVFTSWVDALADRFTAAGIALARARELSHVTIAALEGAFVLARATRSVEPVLTSGRELAAVIRRELPD